MVLWLSSMPRTVLAMRAITSTTSRTEACIAVDHVGDLVGRVRGGAGECLDLLGDDRRSRGPGVPARAASMVALRASRWVCSATPRMTVTVSPICSDESRSAASTTSARSARPAASRAVVAASEALSATSRMDPESWAVPVATEVDVVIDGTGSAGHAAGLAGRLLGGRGELLGDGRELVGGTVDDLGACGDLAQSGPDVADGRGEGLDHAADLVLGRIAEGRGEVTLRQPLEAGNATVDRPGDRAADQRAQQEHHDDRQCHGADQDGPLERVGGCQRTSWSLLPPR